MRLAADVLADPVIQRRVIRQAPVGPMLIGVDRRARSHPLTDEAFERAAIGPANHTRADPVRRPILDAAALRRPRRGAPGGLRGHPRALRTPASHAAQPAHRRLDQSTETERQGTRDGTVPSTIPCLTIVDRFQNMCLRLSD